MKIAGQSFAYLTQLTGEGSGRAGTSAADKASKRAAERDLRIQQVREAQARTTDELTRKSFKAQLGDSGQQDQKRKSAPVQREAVNPAPPKPREKGSLVNIVI